MIRRKLRALIRYYYPLTAAYLAVMMTVVVILLVTDPSFTNCKC